MKILILTLLLLSCIFTVSCIFSSASQPQLSALEAYWQQQSDVRDMAVDMKDRLGFIYKNDIDDISYYTNYAKEPSVLFSDKYANCLDYTSYFTNYIKYRNSLGQYIADSYETMLMLSNRYLPKSWHYVSYISIHGFLYEQSNCNIYLINSIEEQKNLWYDKGYRYFEIKDRWQK